MEIVNPIGIGSGHVAPRHDGPEVTDAARK